ncbi:transcriptional regulator [Streptosporangium sp. NBC_01755]|uniref:transcriptional regulator n=1 Tax=unclassified Streptosporangium TaxID=2632669 RepID=UPI002DD96524|nr:MULTISPECIES: transcriptional regulator [unclassified Streptosporangium]WSA25936.1 transcriptional regulator [Streptosporangium sp. NBC_01810]WSD02675.1 transcriptional regulator [Streptosporangium sp. NBC_01755]
MPSLSYSTSVDLLVLHTLRCIGSAGLARVSEAAGLPEPDVESELIDLAVAGLVTYVPGDFGGWGLTKAGRVEDAERISAELDAAGTRATVAEAYDGFLVLNPELLDLCTAWQLRSVDGVVIPNDHTDPAYDSRVLDRLAHLDRRADVVCAQLYAAMLRFQRYRVRLTDALTRARSGELDYVTDSLASYHSVWFQLHEDLLVTLGIPRH